MKTICFLLILSSFLNVLLAYPVDYNETAVAELDELLNLYRTLALQPNFTSILQEFYNQISSTNTNMYKEIIDTYRFYISSLATIEENANNLNVDISQCNDYAIIYEIDVIHTSYIKDCVETFTKVGENIVSIGKTKQFTLFNKKYVELMNDYRACIAPGETAPKICAGVFAATIQEAQRIVPSVKSYALGYERELKKEILDLTLCANTHLSLANQKLQNQVDIVRECVLSKIVVADSKLAL